jgi:hypothetical protein
MHTDRHTDRQTDRHACIHTYIHTYKFAAMTSRWSREPTNQIDLNSVQDPCWLEMVGECTIPYIGDHHPSWDFRSEPTRNSCNDVAGSAKRLAIHSGLGKLPGLTHGAFWSFRFPTFYGYGSTRKGTILKTSDFHESFWRMGARSRGHRNSGDLGSQDLDQSLESPQNPQTILPKLFSCIPLIFHHSLFGSIYLSI